MGKSKKVQAAAAIKSNEVKLPTALKNFWVTGIGFADDVIRTIRNSCLNMSIISKS